MNPTGVLLIPKLRSHFAEFLNECSLKRLRIFSSSTCVGLRYGYAADSLEVFLGSVFEPLSELALSSELSKLMTRGFASGSFVSPSTLFQNEVLGLRSCVTPS